VVEPSPEQALRLRSQFGVQADAAAGPALGAAGLIVWAVKPQVFEAAAAPCAPYASQALQLSIMAGIPCAAIEKASGSARVVRAMPNTPALIGQGMSGLYARPAVTLDERLQVEQMLAPPGSCCGSSRRPSSMP
jgi:pyrroline-5-carboxylate reductase